MTKNIYDVKNDLYNGVYTSKPIRHPKFLKDNHVFDENKSVKWNREQVEIYNKNEGEKYNAALKEKHNCAERLKNDVVEALSASYNLSKDAVETAYHYAMSKSPNMSELIDKTEEVLDLYENILEASKRT